MAVLPRTIGGLVGFCESHAGVWTERAAEIGLTPGQAEGLGAAAEEVREAMLAQRAAQEAARAATAALNAAARALRERAAGLVRAIKTHAESGEVDREGVYAAAQIPAPGRPAPLPEPGTPGSFRASLTPDGMVDLRWSCVNPPGAAGTSYLVWRRVGGEGAFEFLGAVGRKRFVDRTLPAGAVPEGDQGDQGGKGRAGEVTYRVEARRSGLAGTPGLWTVRFGTGGVIGEVGIAGEEGRRAA